MSGAVLLTGATGFLGMDALARLIERGGEEDQVAVLIRARDDAGAQQRLREVLARLYDELPAGARRVRAVRGDLLEPGLGLSAEDRRWLIDTVERIVHCAASISFELSLVQARAINVGGVERVLELARAIADGGALRRIVHVSTAYVSGRHAGEFRERDLDIGQEFRNTYERSKAEAERLLRDAGDLPLAVARPSIVVGDSASGWTSAFNVLYWPMRAFERGLLDEVPAREDSIVDFVPVDYVTDGILALLDDETASGTYNLVAGADALSAGELVQLYSAVTGREPVRFIAQDGDAGAGAGSGGLPLGGETFVPYFDVRCRFGDDRARELLARAGVVRPDPQDYLVRLIAYARASAWGKRGMTREGAFSAVDGRASVAGDAVVGRETRGSTASLTGAV
ncbi:MAG TPA: SDR family oxidoreductase [Solirubrobacteraceae bacterium]|jgi:thioester reductase-like protein|nr:SDR family oxidoreductase [Solirubrobacteraceae bacterium]